MAETGLPFTWKYFHFSPAQEADTQRVTKPLAPSYGYLRDPLWNPCEHREWERPHFTGDGRCPFGIPMSTGNAGGSQMAPKRFLGSQNETSCNSSSAVNACYCSTDHPGCCTFCLYALWPKCKLDFCKQKLGWCIQLYFFKLLLILNKKVLIKKASTLHNSFCFPFLLTLFSNALVMGKGCSKPSASIIAFSEMSVLDQGMLGNCCPTYGGDSWPGQEMQEGKVSQKKTPIHQIFICPTPFLVFQQGVATTP